LGVHNAAVDEGFQTSPTTNVGTTAGSGDDGCGVGSDDD
jgi:hypothetical protein